MTDQDGSTLCVIAGLMDCGDEVLIGAGLHCCQIAALLMVATAGSLDGTEVESKRLENHLDPRPTCDHH